MYDGFTREILDERYCLFRGQLPVQLLPGPSEFERLWELHPREFHEIIMHGRPVKTPRWQRAFGKDYHYTQTTNKALPIPDFLQAFHTWFTRTIDERLNGLLLNWYDGHKGHYIGKHRDSTVNMVLGAPIVTISLGEDRIFRLRPWKAQGVIDFTATNGTVFIMPYETNLGWTHEVPHSARYIGRRISITARAFGPAKPDESHAV